MGCDVLDTICVQYTIKIAKEFLSNWDYEKRQKKGSYSFVYKLVIPTQNGCGVTYRYVPRTPAGYPLLQVEFSLPHLVFGDNTNLICGLEGAINQANLMRPDVPGIPQLDLWKGTLYRLDIYYNFQDGRLVPFYIQALLPLEIARRKTRPYTNQGVQYGNKQVALKLYSKEQCYIDKKLPINPDAKGVLRSEVTLRRNAVKRLTGKKYPTLRGITIELAVGALENELQRLGLLNRSIGTYDTTLEKLCEIYGTDAGFCYFGALAARVEYPSRETVIAASDIHPRTMDRRLKKVLAAGLPLTMTKADEPLPPLIIDREMIMEKAKQGASVIKYQVIPQAFQMSAEVTRGP
jgi:hypothetical protein